MRAFLPWASGKFRSNSGENSCSTDGKQGESASRPTRRWRAFLAQERAFARCLRYLFVVMEKRKHVVSLESVARI